MREEKVEHGQRDRRVIRGKKKVSREEHRNKVKKVQSSSVIFVFNCLLLSVFLGDSGA